MDPVFIGIIFIGLFIVMVLLGVPIGVGMGITGFVGILVCSGWSAGFSTLRTIPYTASASWSLSVIPMFLLMGYATFEAGFMKKFFSAASMWLSRLPGGMAIATLVGGAGFGACCGSSLAATAALGKAALPELERFKYDVKLSAGTVAVSGTLAALIPPSVLLVLYGIVTEVSIGKLLIAGLIPGILSMLVFSMLVITRVKLNPALAPLSEEKTWKEKMTSLKNVIPILLIFIFVMGGLFVGIFTPSEAGAAGAIFVLAVAGMMGKLTGKIFKASVLETAIVTCGIFVIVVGAYIFIQFLALTGLPMAFAEFAAGLPVHRWIVFACLVVVYLILGCFMDAIGLLLLTVPFVFPAVTALGFDSLWFGVIVVKLIEIGLLTPPVGIQVYVLKSVAPHLALKDIFIGIYPFFLVDLFFTIVVLSTFPEIVTWLPSFMK